jgi:hypothetical protein
MSFQTATFHKGLAAKAGPNVCWNCGWFRFERASTLVVDNYSFCAFEAATFVLAVVRGPWGDICFVVVVILLIFFIDFVGGIICLWAHNPIGAVENVVHVLFNAFSVWTQITV